MTNSEVWMPPPPAPPSDDYRRLFYCGTFFSFPIVRSYSDSLSCHRTDTNTYKIGKTQNYYSPFHYSDLKDGMIFAARPDVMNAIQSQVEYTFRLNAVTLHGIDDKVSAGLNTIRVRSTTEDEKLLYILDSVDRS